MISVIRKNGRFALLNTTSGKLVCEWLARDAFESYLYKNCSIPLADTLIDEIDNAEEEA